MNRLCGLDLLRAIAIIWVMLFHATKYGTPSRDLSGLGWMGVDLFFVLSGFLIGSQLFKLVAQRQEVNLSELYLNRVFRILPAYIVVLTIYFLVPFTREGNGLQPLWQFLSFSVNLFIDTSSNNTFSHVWSLCIEEYFYLFFPIVVLQLMHRSSVTKILVLSLFIIAFGMYLRGYIWVNELGWGQSYIENIYYPTYTRLDGLLAGVLLAALKVFKPELWKFTMNHANKVLLVGLSGLATAIWLFKARFGYMATVIGFPILSFSFAFIVAGASSPNSILGKYKVPGVYFVATLAYSLYLTHKFVFHIMNTNFGEQLRTNGYIAFFVYGIAALLVAIVLYVVVERPFLKLRSTVVAWDNRKPQKIAEINS
ncbi:MAG: acyltransferase [Colwellia sp.]|uniref:acyltransferase family protein n=1 Tax=Colwellia sp. TaxID=56799 RepID=UPI001DB6423E|nr:acyltransferase [Colwellia sp.]NQY50549.1 acyltransferase [Colwellia sp.]